MYLADKTGQPWEETIRRALGSDTQVDAIIPQASGIASQEELEITVLKRVFGAQLKAIPISGQAAAHGVNLAAGSSSKLALVLEMLRRQELLPTIGCNEPAAYAAGLDIVREPRKTKLRRILINHLGFGGVINALVLRYYEHS